MGFGMLQITTVYSQQQAQCRLMSCHLQRQGGKLVKESLTLQTCLLQHVLRDPVPSVEVLSQAASK